MGVLNPSFESPGALVGQAAYWTESSPASEAVGEAPFGSYPFPFEGYDEWWGSEEAVSELTAFDVYPAIFEGDVDGFEHTHEGFESSWRLPAPATFPPRYNHLSLFSLSDDEVEAAVFATSGDERFENGWLDNELFETSYGAGQATSDPAFFQSPGYPLDPERFDHYWLGNEDAQTSFAPGDVALALFETSLASAEIFTTAAGPGFGWDLVFSF